MKWRSRARGSHGFLSIHKGAQAYVRQKKKQTICVTCYIYMQHSSYKGESYKYRTLPPYERDVI
jgi:hypothetical protein